MRHYSTLFVSFQLHRPLLPLLAKNRSAVTNLTSKNHVSDSDISDRHFLFDKRWRNGTYITNGIEGTSFHLYLFPFIVSVLVYKWGKRQRKYLNTTCIQIMIVSHHYLMRWNKCVIGDFSGVANRWRSQLSHEYFCST